MHQLTTAHQISGGELVRNLWYNKQNVLLLLFYIGYPSLYFHVDI